MPFASVTASPPFVSKKGIGEYIGVTSELGRIWNEGVDAGSSAGSGDIVPLTVLPSLGVVGTAVDVTDKMR